MPRSRQLAAIMFTDIEGYTALMQQNEEKAIQSRARHRKVFDSITEKHKGRVLQYYGDGTLSIFDSAFDAVKCGIEMQLGFQKDPIIPVRIGIHTGDIIFSEEEIIGDGVNVAARIESLAVPGSVFISEKVYDEIKNQESIKTSMLKAFKLKNVSKPIEVYAISNQGLVVPNPENLKGKTEANASSSTGQLEHSKSAIRLGIPIILVATFIAIAVLVYLRFGNDMNIPSESLEKSIAVLAFENMSGDVDQEYFSDGISEEILNALTHVNGLKVAGRTSAFSFKEKNEDIRSIGEKLDVQMVLEGSVRKAGTQVRITAQLINVSDGFHLWSETYNRELEDIFAIQDEIAAEIVEKLKLQIQESPQIEVPSQNLEAYDLLLKGIFFLDKDYEGARQAMHYFQKAVEVDPDYAKAHALIAETYNNYAVYGMMPGSEAYSLARTAAQKAIGLDESEPRAHKVLAYIHLFYDWDWEAAFLEYNKAILHGLRAPDHFITFYHLFLHKDFEQAIEISAQILDLDPLHIENHWHVGFCELFAGAFENALISFNNALELDPNYSEGLRWKAVTLSYLDNFEEALISIEKALDITQGQGPANLDLLELKIRTGKQNEVLQTLRDLEESGEPVDPMGPAILYTWLEMPEQALNWLEKAYRERSFMMITLKAYWLWDHYKENPRFIEIYNRMNFPE
ncbi:MAG: hypothetical protein OEQ53_04915 [Saprospiraceae bacterium]|nr:hypothetical protein [Saprospiraceae bacterium]